MSRRENRLMAGAAGVATVAVFLAAMAAAVLFEEGPEVEERVWAEEPPMLVEVCVERDAEGECFVSQLKTNEEWDEWFAQHLRLATTREDEE